MRRGELPNLTQYDYTRPIPAGFGPFTNSFSKASVPPLQGGRYFIGIYNPNSVSQRVRVFVRFDLDVNGVAPLEFISQGTQPILDDAITYSSILITNTQRIIRAEVGVAIAHPRVSDLALTLLSPSGKRILLYENRGGPDAADLGAVTTTTNFFGQQRAGDFNANTNILAPVPTSGILIIDYNFHDIPDTLAVTYDGTNVATFTGVKNVGTFTVPYGPGTSTSLEIVMNPGNNTDPNTAWEYTPRVVSVSGSYFIFSENTNSAKLPVKFGVSGVIGGTNIEVSSFEAAARGTFPAPQQIDGWLVESNSVSVLGDPATANLGNGYLALANGTISRDLSVTPGERYRLKFGYRGPGIIGWWRGENLPIDRSGFGNNGFWTNSANYAPGKVGTAFNFAGGNSYVSIPYSSSLSVTSRVSVEFWMRADPANALNTYQGLMTSDFYGVEISNGFDARMGVNMLLSGNGANFVHTSDSNGGGALVSPGVWHHVAATYDGTALQLYIDGLPSGNPTPYAGPIFPMLTNSFFSIGSENGRANCPSCFGTRFFSGQIDEASVYRRALSASEISAIYSLGSTGKFDPNPLISAPLNLAKAQVSFGSQTNVLFGNNTTWAENSVIFKPTTTTVPLRISGLEPGMLLDSFSLDQLPEDQFVLPEESLDALIGDSAFGKWTLEVWDTRAGQIGASNVVPQIASWEMRFILENPEFTVRPLTNGVAVTNTLAPCQIDRYSVDVPNWAGFAVNRLLFSVPSGVNVWFSSNAPPTGGNFGDVLLITPAPSTNGSFTMVKTNQAPFTTPPLVPGSRYFLSVENPCAATTNVTYAIRVDFGPDIITLTNMVPYATTNSGSTNLYDFYRFVVPTNSARAQFEINFPTGDLTLLARRGLPPPTLTAFDYLSQNPSTNDELIVVITNSAPIPLGPGDWYLTAVNQSGASVSYSALATAWPVTGRPFAVTNLNMSSNSLCLTWTSLPGVHYYVQGVQALSLTNWYNVSPTLTAGPTEYSMTYCIGLPSPFQYFRVVEGLALFGVPEPPPALSVRAATNGFLLQWIGSVTAHYQPQWTPTIAPPVWTSFTNVVTSTNNWFFFLDDGSQSGGLNGPKYYRIQQVP